MPQLLITGLAAAPTQITINAKNTRLLFMVAQKNLDGLNVSANTGNVAIGHSATAGNQPILFKPGDERVWFPSSGMMFDLSRFYLAVANDGDGLVIFYE